MQLAWHLGRRKVLVVVDDVGEHDQLHKLLPTEVLHPASLVIMTSSLLHNRWQRSAAARPLSSSSAAEMFSTFKLLPEGLAEQLFAAHAFGGRPAEKAVAGEVQEVVDCCGGLPLTLKQAVPVILTHPESCSSLTSTGPLRAEGFAGHGRPHALLRKQPMHVG